jgi:prepilin-type N-terminal cleavage/methylation domain-containing protein
MKRNPSRHHAFSLLELLSVVVVIGILAFLIASSTASGREKVKRAQCDGLLRQFYLSVKMYADDNEGQVAEYRDFLSKSPMICPSDKSKGSIAVYMKSSFNHSPFIFASKRKLDDTSGQWWMLGEFKPWHDRSKQPSSDPGKWRGRFNTLYADGSLRWELLEQ